MFTKINIKKFGLYKDFTWPEDLPEFGRVNIIYGRNYSGKTTLSRIFDSVGQGELHKDYLDGEFTLHTDDVAAPMVTQSNIKDSPNAVRVYNSDFVKRNLSWLNDEDGGEIKPFALIGSVNVEAQRVIDQTKLELGDVEQKTGLRYELENKNSAFEVANSKIKKAEQELEAQLKEKARRDINSNIYFVKPGSTYNVTSIKKDIEDITIKDEKGMLVLNRSFLLKKNERDLLRLTVKQAQKPEIQLLPVQILRLNQFYKEIRRLVSRRITMSNTLQELVENDLLQAWVDEGRKVNHRRKVCAFCGNPISKERWHALNAHFSKQSEELKAALLEEKAKLVKASKALDGFLELRYFIAENIYVAYLDDYEKLMKRWDAFVVEYHTRVEELLNVIDERLKNIFVPIITKPKKKMGYDDSVKVMEVKKGTLSGIKLLRKMNALIEKNNAYGTKLEGDKQAARNKLRLDYVYAYCRDIGYINTYSTMLQEEVNLMFSVRVIKALRRRIESKEALIEQKELEKKDESKAAKQVTDLLSNHFGNGSLSLESVIEPMNMGVGEGTIMPVKAAKTKFVIKRGGVPAKNLSDGEKSLISFCYFVTKMNDELKGPEADKLVVYIDDPISSLDSSHVFFMYSLIETVFIKNLSFCQLFISTHNLEFLKFTKRIRPVVTTGSKAISKYVVVKLGKGTTDDYRSEIRKMPEYLSKYMTEYNFLFEQIYEVAKLESDEEQTLYGEKYTQYYNIGNNMRKFLECYLFYRYPDTDDPLRAHLAQLFDENVPSAVNRVVNEYSHLAWAERGMRVMDVPEVATAARDILKALQKKDPEHYETLCKSVGVSHEI